jgi:hypothetical protein
MVRFCTKFSAEMGRDIFDFAWRKSKVNKQYRIESETEMMSRFPLPRLLTDSDK